MSIPLSYNLRNLRVRWRSTLATMIGIALVVTVFIFVRALAHGMESTYINTGDERNLIVLRKGSTAESSSQISREEARRIKYLDGVARDEHGEPLALTRAARRNGMRNLREDGWRKIRDGVTTVDEVMRVTQEF